MLLETCPFTSLHLSVFAILLFNWLFLTFLAPSTLREHIPAQSWIPSTGASSVIRVEGCINRCSLVLLQWGPGCQGRGLTRFWELLIMKAGRSLAGSRYLLQPRPVASLLLCEAHDFPSENPGIWEQNGSFQHPVQGHRFHHLQVPGRYK